MLRCHAWFCSTWKKNRHLVLQVHPNISSNFHVSSVVFQSVPIIMPGNHLFFAYDLLLLAATRTAHGCDCMNSLHQNSLDYLAGRGRIKCKSTTQMQIPCFRSFRSERISRIIHTACFALKRKGSSFLFLSSNSTFALTTLELGACLLRLLRNSPRSPFFFRNWSS